MISLKACSVYSISPCSNEFQFILLHKLCVLKLMILSQTLSTKEHLCIWQNCSTTTELKKWL